MLKILMCMSAIFHLSEGNFRAHHDELEKEDESGVYSESNFFRSSDGECWHRAVEDLDGGCKELTATKHRELTLEFTNCFLRSSGLGADACENKPLKECLSSNDRTLSTFTQVFIHTLSMCQFHEHKMWQKETADLIVKLPDNSAVLSQIEEVEKESSMLLHAQKLVLEKQEKLLKIVDRLNKEMEEVHSSAKKFKLITSKQVKLLSRMLESIKHYILVVFTVVFYLMMLAASYMLTSTPFTLPARLVLFVVVILSAIIERTIINYSIQDELDGRLPLDTKDPLYTRIWFLRKTACVAAASILIFYSFKYRHDVQRNAQLLGQIRRQQMETLDIQRNAQLLDQIRRLQMEILDIQRNAQLLGQIRRQIMETLDILREKEVWARQMLAAAHPNEEGDT